MPPVDIVQLIRHGPFGTGLSRLALARRSEISVSSSGPKMQWKQLMPRIRPTAESTVNPSVFAPAARTRTTALARFMLTKDIGMM